MLGHPVFLYHSSRPAAPPSLVGPLSPDSKMSAPTTELLYDNRPADIYGGTRSLYNGLGGGGPSPGRPLQPSGHSAIHRSESMWCKGATPSKK